MFKFSFYFCSATVHHSVLPLFPSSQANGIAFAVSHIYPDVVQRTYSLALLGLNVVYAGRARRYASTSARRAAFLSLLIGESKVIFFLATTFLSCVISVPLCGLFSFIVVIAAFSPPFYFSVPLIISSSKRSG
jgi:hypothetical protein